MHYMPISDSSPIRRACLQWLQDSTLCLQKELQLPVVLLSQEVVVKEVYVEPRLQHRADPHNPLPITWLC